MMASALSSTVAVLFGSAMFAYASLSIALFLGAHLQGTRTSAGNAAAINNAKQYMANTMFVLSNISKLGLVLAYVYVCEHYSHNNSRRPPHHDDDDDSRAESLDFILFTIGLVFVASFMSARPARSCCGKEEEDHTIDDALLPRSQTREWQGWMQLVLLLLPLAEPTSSASGEGDDDDVGNANPYILLILANAFLWLTGFGHATYLDFTNDYSVRRMLLVLLRLNLLPLLLMMILGTEKSRYIDLHPVCFLHSIAYLLVYVTMAVSQRREGRREGQSSSPSSRRRYVVLGLFLFLLCSSFVVSWTIPSAKEGHGFVQVCRLLLPTLFGVSCATNRHYLTGLFHTLTAGPPWFANTQKRAVMVSFGVFLTAGWGGRILIAPQQSPAAWPPRPVLAVYAPLVYILVRNIAPGARDQVLTLFSTIGSMSLELYVLHRHILDQSFGNVGDVATLLARYSKLRLLATGLICCCTARVTKVATTAVLRTCLYKMQRDAMIQVLIVSCSVYFLCYFFNSLGAATVPVILGWTIFQIALKSGDPQVTPKMRVSAPLACAVVALLLGTCWQSTLSASTVTIGLDKDCARTVLDGAWVPVDTCTDSVLDVNRATSFGTCQSLQWAWKTADPKCFFTHRTPNQIRRELRNHTLTFIGDSEIRHLYYAFCRSVGDSSAGAYNTSMEKHSDISRSYDDVLLEFRWAPFVQNLVTALATVNMEKSSDVIILGGGAWDRLHNFTDDNDKQKLRSNVNHLLQDVQSTKENTSIVWVTPTTINSWALNTEQKRSNIREEQMEAFRDLYLKEGVAEASTFLFHGPAYTRDRADESYDGVHYPFSVYDGGAQILANALDWLLVDGRARSNERASPTGSQLPIFDIDFFEVVLLLVTLCLGLFVHDNFFGVFCFASILVHGPRPHNMLHLSGAEAQTEGNDSDEESKDAFT